MTMKKSTLMLSLMLVSLASASVANDYSSTTTTSTSGSDQSGAVTGSGVAPDNTAVNKRDQSSTTLTPEDQSNSQADIDISSAIRKAIVDKDVSTMAKNIKIVTVNGTVTLRGPVKTQAEKDQLAAIASATPGVKSLSNQLEVKLVSNSSK